MQMYSINRPGDVNLRHKSGSTRIITVLCFIQTYSCTIANRDCDDGWLYNNNSNYCYQLSTDMLNWDEANTQCRLVDAYLASILDDDENNFVSDMLKKKNVVEAWLGLFKKGLTTETHRESVEFRRSGWEWVDGKPYNYSQWILGQRPEPSGYESENSTRIKKDGKWGDKRFSEKIHYVCKNEAEMGSTRAPQADTVEEDVPPLPDEMVSEVDKFVYLGVGIASLAVIVLLTAVCLYLRRYRERKKLQSKTSEEATETMGQQNAAIYENPDDVKLCYPVSTGFDDSQNVYENHYHGEHGNTTLGVNKDVYAEVQKPRTEREGPQSGGDPENDYDVTIVDNIVYGDA